jgi:hypothetical protein
MDVYRLMWNGRLWSVKIPAELASAGERDRWTYVQAFVASTGHHGSAMMRFLQGMYPGLGFSGFSGSKLNPPVSVTSVLSVSSRPSVACSSSSDTSLPSSETHTYSQKPRPPASTQGAKDGAGRTGGPHRPAVRSATSDASRSPVTGPGPMRSTPISEKQRPSGTSRPHTGGWMGSRTTSGGASRVAPSS